MSECLGTRTKSVGNVVMLLFEQSMMVSLSSLLRLQEQLSVQLTSIDGEGKGHVRSLTSDSKSPFVSSEDLPAHLKSLEVNSNMSRNIPSRVPSIFCFSSVAMQSQMIGFPVRFNLKGTKVWFLLFQSLSSYNETLPILLKDKSTSKSKRCIKLISSGSKTPLSCPMRL